MLRFIQPTLTRTIYQNPEEKPPGGTRLAPSPEPLEGAEASAEEPLVAGFESAAACTGAGPADSAEEGGASFTFSFASTVPTQYERLDEFCWLYVGRGLMGHASGSPKMFEWPPPGGFSTRLEFFSPIPEKFTVAILFAFYGLNCALGKKETTLR